MDTSLSPKELDVQRMLACEVHIGTRNVDFQMERYVWRRRQDGARRSHPPTPRPPLLPADRVPPRHLTPCSHRTLPLAQASTSFTWARPWTS